MAVNQLELNLLEVPVLINKGSFFLLFSRVNIPPFYKILLK